MNYLLLILASAVLYFFGIRQWRRNWIETKALHLTETRPHVRIWNWMWNMVWPFYLLVLATGLWLNNLIWL